MASMVRAAVLIYKELTIRGVLSMPVDDTFRAVELIESGRYPFAKIHTHSFPIEQAEDAIHALAGDIPGMNPCISPSCRARPASPCPIEWHSWG